MKEVDEVLDFFESYKTCLDCMSIRNEMFCDGHIFGQVMEDVQNTLYETDGQISEDCILALTPKAREMIFELIEERWKDLEND